jgi:signal transduction histidine kinase
MSLTQTRPGVNLLAHTTYKLIRPFESIALMVQGVTLLMSATADHYRPGAIPVLIGLAALHVALAFLVIRNRGPLTRGHAWPAAWVVAMFVVQLLVAHLLVPGDFGTYSIAAGNYLLIPLVVLSFYPWGGFRRLWPRRLLEIGLVVAVILQPFVIVGVMRHWALSAQNVKSLAQYAGWAVVWYLVGKGIARLCRIAVQAESEALVRSYEAALGDFHIYVEEAAAKIASGRDVGEIGQQLRDITYVRRRQLLMEDSHIGAVDLFKNAIRLFGDRLRPLSLPRLGALTLPREQAIVLERGLVGLLKNVADHGGGDVTIDFTIEEGDMLLDVRDNGPGLSRERFDDPATTMRRLRAEARDLGGELFLLEPDGSGTAIRLVLPVHAGG